jgi:hypothetical protein
MRQSVCSSDNQSQPSRSVLPFKIALAQASTAPFVVE